TPAPAASGFQHFGGHAVDAVVFGRAVLAPGAAIARRAQLELHVLEHRLGPVEDHAGRNAARAAATRAAPTATAAGSAPTARARTPDAAVRHPVLTLDPRTAVAARARVQRAVL